MKRLLLLLLVFAIWLPLPVKSADDGTLLKIVALSRHGVRAPTQSQKYLEDWSQKTWPAWPVAKGDLTPRGADLITAMWSEFAPNLRRHGLLPENACPSQNSIYVRADVDERTKATARALLEGIAPNCGLGFAVLPDTNVDPLFHPVKAGLYSFNPVSVATDILRMTDGGLEELQNRLTSQITLVSEILGAPSPALCTHFTMGPNCKLTDLPNAISISPNGSDVRLMGSLDIASSVAEIFLLEFAEWPGQAAGWGHVTEKNLDQVLDIHARIFDIVNRAPVVAWAKGSSLLTEMAAALLNQHYDPAANSARLVVFVGHDTNIANIGALLDLNWQAWGFPDNDIPPGSLLALELWEKYGKREVRVKFYAQTPKALHSRLDDSAQPNANKAEFAPVGVEVKSPPVVGQARFDIDAFTLLVGQATEGAPLAPSVNAPLDFNPVQPRFTGQKVN